MSIFRNSLKTYNILNIINSKILREYSETYIKYITNINKDVILLLINGN